MRCLLVMLVVALGLTVAACGTEAGGESNSSTTRLARDYIRAINARDGEGVCALLTEEAAEQLGFVDEGLPCASTVGGLIGYLSRAGLLACRRDVGADAASSAGGGWTAASLADHLAEDERHFVDVRCIDAAGHEGWDFVCTYYDPTLGKRMKVGQSVVAGGKALVGSGSVPEDSWLPPRS